MFKKLFRKNYWPELPIEELRKRSRLLVIDDQSFSYVELFQRDGYTIEKWDDVEDLTKLESGYYDIILLDIQGIGREISIKEQGFGVLKHVKKVNPTQIIVAYSNKEWSFKYAEFFDLADSKLAKTDDYVVFKEEIDELLKNKFSLGFYVSKINSLATKYGADTQKLESLSKKAIVSKDNSKLENYLKSVIENKEIIQTILQIASVAAQLYISMAVK